jgi:hypothetical protein
MIPSAAQFWKLWGNDSNEDESMMISAKRAMGDKKTKRHGGRTHQRVHCNQAAVSNSGCGLIPDLYIGIDAALATLSSLRSHDPVGGPPAARHYQRCRRQLAPGLFSVPQMHAVR